MKRLGILVLFVGFLFVNNSFAQTKINWMSWEEMMAKQKVEKKKIIIDLYTDWCFWCKKMDEGTFKNPFIVEMMNKNYYSVKFNAEQREDLEFDGRVFKYVPQGRHGYHEFAAALTQNQLSYPTYVFLDEEIRILQVFSGYQRAKEFEYILSFFGEDVFKTTAWDKFEKEYKPKL